MLLKYGNSINFKEWLLSGTGLLIQSIIQRLTVKNFSFLAGGSIVGLFLWVMLFDSLNIPSYDDFDSTFHFMRHHLEGDITWKDRLSHLLQTHNEHRISMSRLTTLIYFKLAGVLDFTKLIYLQNVYLLAIFVLVIAIMLNQRLKISHFFLPVVCFCFSLSFWQVSFYYAGGITSYSVVFYVMLSLYWLHLAPGGRSGYFLGAFISAVVAMLCFGNGLLVIPLGCFLLWAEGKRRMAGYWVLLVLLLVLFEWVAPAGETPQAKGFNLEWMGRVLFTYLGSFLFVNPEVKWIYYGNVLLCMIAGVGVLLFWIKEFFNGYAFRNPLLYCLLSFPVLTGVLIAISRYQFKAAAGIAPRYMIYTTLIPVFLLFMWGEKGKIKAQWVPALQLGILVIWGLCFVNDRKALQESNRDIVMRYTRWKADNSARLVHYSRVDYSEIMHWSMNNHIWKEPEDFSRLAEASGD